MRLFKLPGLAAETWKRLTEVEIRSGETAQVTVSTNQTVLARLRWSADVRPEPGWKTFAYLQTELPSPPEGTVGNPQAYAAWKTLPEVASAYARLAMYQLQENADGIFIGEEVPPGNYVLHVSAGSAGAKAPVVVGGRPVSVPPNLSGTVDLGEIELRPNK